MTVAKGAAMETKGDVEIAAAYVAGKVKRSAGRAKRKVKRTGRR
ncbi:MAG: hypothetical protein WKG01_02735 [Kofleriaceae bacterium]